MAPKELERSLAVALRPREKHLPGAPGAPSSGTLLGSFRRCTVTRPKRGPSLFTVRAHPRSGSLSVHIFKNAGNTVRDAYMAHGGVTFTVFVNSTALAKENADAMQRLVDSPAWLRTAVVREPLGRVLSAFHEVSKRSHCGSPCCIPACAEARPELMGQWIRTLRHFLTGIDKGTWGETHFIPQAAFLADAKGQKLSMDYIGRTESLQEELAFVLQLPNVSVGERHGPEAQDTPMFRIDRRALPADIVRKVCRIYRDDYCCFGFRFPPECEGVVASC